MSKIRKILLICLTLVCVVFSCVAITACSSKNWRKPDGIIDDGRIDPANPNGDLPFYYPDGINPEDITNTDNVYVIKTASMGGMAVDNVRVTVSKNGQKVVEGISKNGGVKFGGIDFSDYDLSYSELPNGYREDAEGTVYHLTAESLDVTSKFNSSVIGSSMPAGYTYKLGDVMYNFSYTNADGWTISLSELLQTKKAVVLNFWATWCGPCASEFPALNRVYTKYKDKLEVVALSIEKQDYNPIIKNYQNSFNPALEFFMANDNLGLASSLNGTASVPTTVIVDRYGVVALHHVGAITSDLNWEELFKQFTSDNYTQNLEQSSGGETGDKEPVLPPDFIEFEPISNVAFNQAFLDSSITKPLEYYGPAAGTSDAKNSWPFKVAENSTDGMYIAPTNVGTYTRPGTAEEYKTDNTFSLLYTDIELETDDTLTVEVKLNTESGNDRLFIIMNNSTVNQYIGSGSTATEDNPSGWITVQLYKATRPTNLNIAMTYVKNTVGTAPNEFVGLRNLKITKVDYDSPYPIDLRTELSVEDEDGTYTYKNVYFNDEDGFYHVQEGDFIDLENDSIIFVDIMYETLWNDRHISGYSIRSTDGYGLTPSLYNVSFWLFGRGGINFGYGKEESSTILDCFYVQDGRQDYLTPVNEDVKDALVAYTKHAFNNSQIFGSGFYKNGYNDNTWLELCSYYRTYGDHNALEPDKSEHVCKAHTNPGEGMILKYAIDLHEGINHVDTSIASSINFMNGAFYKLTATKTGAYRIKSLLEYVEGDPVDPYIIVWSSTSNAYDGGPLVEQDDVLGVERFIQKSTNFEVIIYLEEGDYVYPQITTRVVEKPGKYDVEVEYLGEEYWQLRVASTGEGLWVGEGVDTAVYAAISTTVLDGPNGKTHYHVLNNGDYGSVVYIDLIHANYFDQNENSLKDMVEHDAFRLDDIDYTSYMNGYIEEALAKDPDDPTYGMVEATDTIVKILSAFMQAETGESIKTGYWKAFAYYYQYFGPTEWADLPL